MLNKLEYPSRLILVLIRLDANDILSKLNTLYSGDTEYNTLYLNISKILDKFKSAILSEGSSLKFTQDSELLNTISKIVVDKNLISEPMLKENRVFNTDTEKFIINTINTNRIDSLAIFNN